MTIRLKNATVVTVLTNLIVSGMVAATTIPVTAQGPSSSSGADATPFLHLAKMHLMEATKDIKAHNSQAAINATKYDSSNNNVSRIKIEYYHYMQ